VLRVGEDDHLILVSDFRVWRSFKRSTGCGGRGVIADAAFISRRRSIRSVGKSAVGKREGRNIPLSLVREFTRGIAGAELLIDKKLGHFSLVIRRAPAALDYLAARAAEADA
jgi:hypothetical protein